MSHPFEQRPDWDDLPHTEWKCEECGKMNSCLDGECQFCDVPEGEDEQEKVPHPG